MTATIVSPKPSIMIQTIKTDMTMNNKKLERSNNRMIAGVCAGLAEFFGIDPTAMRVAYTLLTVFTCFSGVLAYIIMWIIIPPKAN